MARGTKPDIRSFPFRKELGRPGLLRSADVTSKAKGRSSVPGDRSRGLINRLGGIRLGLALPSER